MDEAKEKCPSLIVLSEKSFSIPRFPCHPIRTTLNENSLNMASQLGVCFKAVIRRLISFCSKPYQSGN